MRAALPPCRTVAAAAAHTALAPTLSVHGHASVADKGFIKAWDVSRAEPKQHIAARRLGDPSVPCRIACVTISGDGSRIAATCELQRPPVPAAGARSEHQQDEAKGQGEVNDGPDMHGNSSS